MKHPRILPALFALLGCISTAQSETADRDKPLNYEANRGECDDLKQVCELVGEVVLVKGTMRTTGERVTIRKDADGYQSGIIQAAPGKLATFRQRRDATRPGAEEYVEGYAERIEYDEKTDTVRMVTRARVRVLENDVQRDELRGDSITYDQRNAKYFVTGGKPSVDANNPDGRVRGTIAPRSQAPPPAGSQAPLKPATEIKAPRVD